MDTTGEFRAAVSCESDDHGRTVTTRAEAPSGSPIEIGIGSNNYYSVPQANQEVVIDDDAVGLHVAGTLRSIVRQEPDYAVSTLVLDIDIQSALWPHVSFWTVSMQLVRAECGIGRSLPAVDSDTTLPASRMAMARLAPDSESASPSRSVESSSSTSSASKSAEGSESESSGASSSEESESSSPASASESTSADTPVAGRGPTTPSDVDVGSRFPIVASDGADLGSATIQQVESDAPSEGAPATVAVKMSITTSDAGGGHRLSSVSWKDFGAIVGGVEQDAGRASGGPSPLLPDELEPGRTYTGWVTFTAPSVAGKAIWKPSGTAGFRFVLPEPTVPVTTTTSSPAPVVETPQTSEPRAAAPAEVAPAAGDEGAEDPEPVPTPEKESRSSSDDSSPDSSEDE